MPQPIALSIPFAVDTTGALSIDPSASSQLSSRVGALVATLPGERVMAASFGVNTQTLVFAPGDPELDGELTIAAAQALILYEPTAQLVSVTGNTIDNTGRVQITAVVGRKDVAATASVSTTTVVVGPDGSVTDYASTTAA